MPLVFIFAMLFFSCVSAPPLDTTVLQERMVALERAYQNFLDMDANNVLPDSVLLNLTDDSRYWFESIEQAALYEDSATLEQRPFHEILIIVNYRLLLRENEFTMYPDYKMLRFAIGNNGILRRAKDLKLGPFEIKNDRGSRGLEESPKVPIIIFKWDEFRWKLDMPETVQLMTRGLATIGVKKKWTPSKTAIYLLDKYYHSKYLYIDESLLNPVSSI